MKKVWVAAGAVLLTAVVAYTARAAQGIKEGKWSMSMTMQAEGMGNEAASAAREMAQMSPEDRAMMQQMMGGMCNSFLLGGPGYQVLH